MIIYESELHIYFERLDLCYKILTEKKKCVYESEKKNTEEMINNRDINNNISNNSSNITESSHTSFSFKSLQTDQYLHFTQIINSISISKLISDKLICWMIIRDFNVHCTVMHCVILWDIKNNKIDTISYYNYHRITIKHTDIIYLQSWKNVKKMKKKTVMIFKKLMTADFTKEWDYIFYKYIISEKHLKTALNIAEKHVKLNNYNIVKIYIKFKQSVKKIKAKIMKINITLTLFITKYISTVTKVKNTVIKNLAVIKITINSYLVMMLKL